MKKRLETRSTIESVTRLEVSKRVRKDLFDEIRSSTKHEIDGSAVDDTDMCVFSVVWGGIWNDIENEK